jgi:Tol biopolymer transport system component
MAIANGSRLGPYEVLSALGAGGMGEVYRARDSRLDRDVAIKVLPEAVAHDAERLLRFEREARVLASLSHPNIAAIHGFEQLDGRHLLILELIDGPTLADRLKQGPMPVDEALEINKQIAEALEAAHEKGIVHRDLKPANIKLTDDGKVKVLDFGLAKALADDRSGSKVSDSPTITAAHTRPGVVLGTAAYMSPEQARGKPVDKRTDIWSFGCVLYECLTGTSPFIGETISDIIARIVERDPDLAALPARTPPRVRELLRHCLEKNAKRRLRDIGDAVLELEAAVVNREWSSSIVAASTLPLPPPSRRRALAAALAVLALICAGVGGWILGRQQAPVARLAIAAKFVKLTDQGGVEQFPTLSPDGKTVVYAAKEGDNWDIYSLRVGGLNPINLTKGSSKDDSQPCFSPDGSQIVFRSERDGGGLFVMGATGESPRRLTDFGFNPSWSPDGQRVIFATEGCDHPFSRSSISSLWTVNIETGEKKKIADGDAMQPAMSPNGKRIAYWAVWAHGGRRDIYTIPAGGGEEIPVTTDAATDWNPVWSRDGKYLYFCSDRAGSMNLWRVAVDEASGLARGEPEAVTAGVATDNQLLSLSADGRRIAYVSKVESENFWKAELDPKTLSVKDEPRQITHFSGRLGSPAVSPDGQWLACRNYSRQEDIQLLRNDGSDRRQLMNDAAKDRGPVWSPDGRQIGFYSDRSGRYEIWRVNPDGSGLEQLARSQGRSANYPVWNPDGSRTAFTDEPNLCIFDPRKPWAQQEPELIPCQDENGVLFTARSWSPDGSTLACELSRSGQESGIGLFLIEARSFQKILDSGLYPVWLEDGRHLAFADGDTLCLIDVQSKEVKKLLSVAPDLLGEGISMGRGDKSTYFSRRKMEADIWLMELE